MLPLTLNLIKTSGFKDGSRNTIKSKRKLFTTAAKNQKPVTVRVGHSEGKTRE